MSRYIDADELINDLIKSTPIDWNNYIADVQEVKHGRWIWEPVLGMSFCSECSWGNVKGERRHYNYCPNCGARMVNEDD